MWRTVRTVAGFSLIVLGVIGTLVPVVPGIPMVLAGMALERRLDLPRHAVQHWP